MKIYRVNYKKINFNKYFQGAYNYYDNAEKFFTTQEKAEEFVATEEKEYVQTWQKEKIVKAVGVGKIEEIEVI